MVWRHLTLFFLSLHLYEYVARGRCRDDLVARTSLCSPAVSANQKIRPPPPIPLISKTPQRGAPDLDLKPIDPMRASGGASGRAGRAGVQVRLGGPGSCSRGRRRGASRGRGWARGCAGVARKVEVNE